MNKKFAKLLSILLCAALLLPTGIGFLQAKAAGPTPVVYFHGDEGIFRKTEDGQKIKLFDDGEYMSRILDEALPLAARAILSGDWSAYNAKVLEIVEPATCSTACAGARQFL